MPKKPKTDRRVERTKAALRDALVWSMTTKGFDATTVQDVLDRANVGRATFYAHYSGKQALHDDSLDMLVAELRARRDALRAEDPRVLLACCTAMFEHADSARTLYRGLVGRRGGTTVLHGVRMRMAVLVREELQASRMKRGGGGIPLDLLVEHAVSGFIACLTWWLDHKTGLGPREIDDHFRRLTLPGLMAEL